ncbi:MAG TPA: phosphoenolpyruvate carboxylase, partial [Candidatus Obscuribacterales bacterium]
MSKKTSLAAPAASGERDKALRDDVRMLGTLLGDTIRRFDGEGVFQTVERFRTLCKSLHQNRNQETLDELRDLIAGIDDDTAGKVIKAFLTYFDLINIAEQNHRVRRRTEREANATADAAEPDSLIGLAKRLESKNISARALHETLERLDIQVVFTAHPTEITRRTVLIKQLELAQYLTTKDHPPLGRRERKRLEDGLRNAVESLWLTDHVIYFKPSVLDEVRYGLYHFENVVIDAVLEVHSELHDLLAQTSGASGTDITKRDTFLTFGSWIGGDRDGNPFVTPTITFQTLEHQRTVILKRYMKDMETLFNQLSHSSNWTAPTQALLDSLEKDHALFPELATRYAERYAHEITRQKLLLMNEKLRAALEMARSSMAAGEEQRDPRAYKSAEEYRKDLQLIHESLREAGCSESLSGLERVIRATDIFGFHLAKLDIRQHSERHRTALDEIAGRLDIGRFAYSQWTEEERINWLAGEI